MNRQPGMCAASSRAMSLWRTRSKLPAVSAQRPNRPLTHVLMGGECDKLGERVEPGFLSAITGNSEPALLPGAGLRRHQPLARGLGGLDCQPAESAHRARDGEPDLAVSFRQRDRGHQQRFWQERRSPTHPELLDWLALEFEEKKWSVKAMHRLIMTSAVYRQIVGAFDGSGCRSLTRRTRFCGA